MIWFPLDKNLAECEVCVTSRKPVASPDEYQWQFYTPEGNPADENAEPPFMPLKVAEEVIGRLAGRGITAVFSYEIP
jgi:hypothetical protein